MKNNETQRKRRDRIMKNKKYENIENHGKKRKIM